MAAALIAAATLLSTGRKISGFAEDTFYLPPDTSVFSGEYWGDPSYNPWQSIMDYRDAGIDNPDYYNYPNKLTPGNPQFTPDYSIPTEDGELNIEEFRRILYNYLLRQWGNHYAASAVMGNVDCEGVLPYRLESDYCTDGNGVYFLSWIYTQMLDRGDIDRDSFCLYGPGGGGYGLCQWTKPVRKAALYDYAKEMYTSVGDWKMQCNFMYQEINSEYPEVYDALMNGKNIAYPTKMFCDVYENPGNYNLEERIRIAKEYFERYSGEYCVVGYYDASVPFRQSGESVEDLEDAGMWTWRGRTDENGNPVVDDIEDTWGWN